MLKVSGKAGSAGKIARMARKHTALLSGTALTAFVAAGMFSPMSVQQAMAACTVVTGGSPDTIDCALPGDVDGVALSTGDGTGVDVTFQPGATLTNPGGTSMDVTMTGGALTVKEFNFDMTPSNTSVSGAGTQINVNRTTGALRGDWTIGGNIQSTTGDAIVITSAGGTGVSSGNTIDINVLPSGSVEGAGSGIIYNATTGASRVNITNDGQIFGGTGNAISLNAGVANIGGTMTVINNGEIGNAGHASTGSAISMTGLAVNGVVTNNEDGSIYAAGDGVNMLLGGRGTVTNDGEITSTAGTAVNLRTGGTVTVTNNAGGVITGNTGGISAVSLLGNANVTSPGDVTTTNGTAVFAASLTGDTTVNTDGGVITSTNGSGIVGAALTDGDVTVTAGEVNAGAGGITLTAPFDTFALPIGGGVIAISNEGNATVNANGNISVASGGTFGAAAISLEGEAEVNAQGIVVDPPLIGLSAIVLGGGMNATVNGQTSTVDADIVGMLAFNAGTGDAIVNSEGATVGANAPTPIAGIVGATTGGGNVDINADADTVVNATNVGVIGLASGGLGNASVASGTTTVTNGIGVTGISEGGNVDIITYGNTTVGGAGGLWGVGGFAAGNVDIDLQAQTVTNTTGAGVLGISLDVGDVDIEAEGSTVNATALVGIMGLATEGNVYIDSGSTTATNGSGVIGVAIDGNVDIETHAQTTAGGALGLVGVGGFASGNVDIDLLEQTVTNTTGAGVIGISFDVGDVDIEGEGSTVNATAVVGIMGLATEGNVYIDSGSTTATNGSGVVGVALDGNVNIETHAQTTAGGALGLVGVGGFASGDVDIDLLEQTVTNTTGAGVIGISFDVGDVDIEGEGSTVNATAVVGIMGLATEGNVYIDSGSTTATNGSGVVGVALDGNVNIETHAQTTAAGALGLVGVGGFASGDVDIDLLEQTVTNTTGAGVIGISFDVGDVDIEGEGSTVNAQTLVGVMGLATEGNVYIDSGSTTVQNGSGVVGVALDGNVNIETHAQTTAAGALGLVGVGGFASGNVDIDLLEQTVTNTTGMGVVGVSFDQGDVDIEGEGSTINSNLTGILAISTDGNVYVDSGEITSTNGSGVIAFANNGNAIVDTHDKISADNGLFGAAAFAVGGDAIVTVGGDIDPPLVGASATTFGPGLAHVDVLDGVSIEADAIGIAASNFGTGNVLVDVGEDAFVQSGGLGILAINIGAGTTDINVEEDAWVIANDGMAVSVLAFDPGAGVNDVNIVNDGRLQGEGSVLLPTIGVIADGSVSIHNQDDGLIRSDGGSAFASAMNVIAGQTIEVINDGTMTGNVTLIAGDVDVNGVSIHFENNSSNTWNWAGVNLFAGPGDIIFDNTVNGTANAGPFSTSIFATLNGDVEINNAGDFFSTGLNVNVFATPNGTSEFNNGPTGHLYVTGFTGFIGLDDFNNEHLVSMSNPNVAPAVDSVLLTTGNFNGLAGSRLAFDAELTPGGVADLLLVGGDVTGVTSLEVTDLDGGPGVYDPNGVLFAVVDGATDVTNFTTNGGIDKGLFRYDAYLLPDTTPTVSGENEWYLASTLDAEAFEFPVIAMGAQNLWHASTGTWLDRTADLRSAFGETGSGIVDLKSGPVAATPGNVTPGAWMKLFGGTAERDFSNVSAPPPAFAGPTYTYDSQWNQDHYGFMVGIDGGRESLTASGQNQAWLVGIMAGYTGSNLDFDSSETDVDYKVGSVGAYVTYLNGGFFADAAVKADFGKMDYSSDLGGGFSDSFSSDFTSVGVTVDTGYRFNNASGWFFEPKATLSYVHTSYDSASVLGTGVSFDDGESLRGRLGARLGTQMTNGANIIEPWIEASAWHEFKGDYAATLTSGGVNLPVGYDVGGTFGEVAGGANIINVGNGWSGFAKGAVQFGDDSYLGFSGNLGVRKAW